MITIQYTCEACSVIDRPVQVPARTTEDVRDWLLNVVAGCVGDDHAAVSPNCPAKKMTMLKLPIPEGTEFVGQQIE